MRILVATSESQGQRPDDFMWCVPGEIVMPPIDTCDNGRTPRVGDCGCSRSWTGLDSHRATTTAVVVEHDLSTADLVERITRSVDRAWGAGLATDMIAEIAEIAARLVRAAGRAEVGTIMECRAGVLAAR